MSELPLVTIGCAVYNGEATLARALGPVLAQDYPNLEILISDDCSTDDSARISKELARNDPRVRILSNTKNVGLAPNFNRLAREASGKYFMWADQDDIRDVTFVRKTCAVLEANPDAVVCHSQTGVFMGDPEDIKYVVTLFGVNGVENRVLRYSRFLNYYSDTVVYGLIRTEALLSTKLWRSDLAAANSLLFELLLRGRFIELPEVLYYYSARGVRNRPTKEEEFARSNPGKRMPTLYFPFLVLARNQTADIIDHRMSVLEKVGLSSVLWGHTCAVAMTKLVYRTLASRIGVPDRITEVCDSIVDPKSHLVFRNGADRDEQLFPKAWVLKGRR